jgi:hypothetical protein
VRRKTQSDKSAQGYRREGARGYNRLKISETCGGRQSASNRCSPPRSADVSNQQRGRCGKQNTRFAPHLTLTAHNN